MCASSRSKKVLAACARFQLTIADARNESEQTIGEWRISFGRAVFPAPAFAGKHVRQLAGDSSTLLPASSAGR